MNTKIKNKEGGFVELIIVIIIALLLMKYFGITVSTVLGWLKMFVDWFTTYFHSILK
ncbi:MAG TPA: hypothetical protein VGO63_00045 [Candidatus Paceibacterota bacterium]|jgi:hypothetical protein|nr:hypothetical protein [Candidatus Paceibacterota bacterium]